MLDLLDQSLRSYLNQVARLQEAEVEVSFEAPDAEWGATASQPTVNVFLWDLGPHPGETRSGMVVSGEGKDRRRQFGQKRLAAQYIITVWGTDVRSEHLLLGAVAQAIFSVPFLGPDHLTGSLALTEPPPTLQVGTLEHRGRGDFWASLGGRVRAGLDLVVGFTVDPHAVPTGPDVLVVDHRVDHLDRVGKTP